MSGYYFFGIFPLDDERDAMSAVARHLHAQALTSLSLEPAGNLHLSMARTSLLDERDTRLEGTLRSIGDAVRFRPGVLVLDRAQTGPRTSDAYAWNFTAGASPRTVLDTAFVLAEACSPWSDRSGHEWTPHVTWAHSPGAYRYASRMIRPTEMTLLSLTLAWATPGRHYEKVAEWVQPLPSLVRDR